MIVRVYPRIAPRLATAPDPVHLLRQDPMQARIRPGEDSVAALSWPAAIWRQFGQAVPNSRPPSAAPPKRSRPPAPPTHHG